MRVPSFQVPTFAKGLSKWAVKYSVYRSLRLLALCGPQKLPAVTEPVTVRAALSIRTVASVLPVSELEVRKSMLAGLSAGKPN